MLSKTIKLGFSLLLTTVIAGCASTSSTDTDTSGPVSTPASTSTTYGSAQPTAAPTPEAITGVSGAEALEDIVYFEFDQAALLPEARVLLAAHAVELKSNPRNLRLEGHADERGTREYNIALGERRAIVVRDFLRSEGVTSLIEVVSYGEERPIASFSNESAWQQNRRVELK